MTRHGKHECPVCFQQMRSDVLKTHCKTKHRISNDQVNVIKTTLANIVRNILVEVSIVVTMNCTVGHESLVM